MTRRGVLTLLLGVAIYVVAWLFGAKALYPVALGLVLAPIVARTWVRLAARPIALRRRIGGGLLGRRASGGHLFEGEDVWVTLEAHPEARVPLPSISVTERIAKLGERHTPLQRARGPYRGTYVIEKLSRGRYEVEEAKATIDDPFGLARSEVDLAAGGSLLVYPRLVALDRLFSESGAHAQDGRRLLLRRPSGFDLHSVREYEQGESLRKVHWRTTARRGQLMVKELEDAPRDEIAVVLDAEASAVAGGASTSRCGLQDRFSARTRRTDGGRCWRSTPPRGRTSGSRHSTATGLRRSAFWRLPRPTGRVPSWSSSRGTGVLPRVPSRRWS